MAKMIKIGCCGGCDKTASMNSKSEPYHFCKELFRINPEEEYLKSLKFYGIYNMGEIHPNCTLPDYPETERENEREG